MAKIIKLDRPRIAPGVGMPDFRFPAVYRTEGNYFETNDNNQLVVGKSIAKPKYSLDEKPAGYANARVSMITHLEPTIDDGWLIIRKHLSEEAVQGYLACLLDQDWLCDTTIDRTTRSIYRTPFGLYSIQHIKKQTERHEDHLLIFMGSRPDWFEEKCWVVRPNGEITTDIDSVLAD